VQNLADWASHLQKENINNMDERDILDNITAIKVYSRNLQSKIYELGDKLRTNIGLFDLILKEKKLIKNKIRDINGKGGKTQGVDCNEVDKIVSSGKVAKSVLKQEVKSVLDEIKRVNYSVKKLEKDERDQKKISKRGVISKSKVHNVNDAKKAEVKETNETIKKISDAAAQMRKDAHRKQKDVKKVKAAIAKKKKEKKIAQRIKRASKKIGKKLKNIKKQVGSAKSKRIVESKKRQLQKCEKILQGIRIKVKIIIEPEIRQILGKKVGKLSKKAEKIKKRIEKKISLPGKVPPKSGKVPKNIKILKTKLSKAKIAVKKAVEAKKIIKKVQQKVKRLNKSIMAKADQIQKLNKAAFLDPSKKRQIKAAISKITQQIKKTKKEVKQASKKVEKQKKILKANKVKDLAKIIQKTKAEINNLQKKSCYSNSKTNRQDQKTSLKKIKRNCCEHKKTKQGYYKENQ